MGGGQEQENQEREEGHVNSSLDGKGLEDEFNEVGTFGHFNHPEKVVASENRPGLSVYISSPAGIMHFAEEQERRRDGVDGKGEGVRPVRDHVHFSEVGR